MDDYNNFYTDNHDSFEEYGDGENGHGDGGGDGESEYSYKGDGWGDFTGLEDGNGAGKSIYCNNFKR